MNTSFFYSSSRSKIRINDTAGTIITPVDRALELPNPAQSDEESDEDDQSDDEIGQHRVSLLLLYSI